MLFSHSLCLFIFYSGLVLILYTTETTSDDNNLCNNGDDSCVADGVELLSDATPIVIIDYQELVDKSDLHSSIATAYGASGLGILLVKNVPDLAIKREKLLRISRQFALELPAKYRDNLINEESFYSIGWSHGKEKLAKNQPDLRKGSFYGNPIFDDPTDGDVDLIKNYPAFYYPNIWPHSMSKDEKSEEIKEIGLLTIDDFGIIMREAFMDFGRLIYQTGGMLSETMDNYVQNVRKHTNYQANTLSNAIQTRHPKARLLYYFSENEFQTIMQDSSTDTSDDSNDNESDDNREDSWCGWHNDHSALTGLAMGMYFNENGEIFEDLKSSVAGLHVKTRSNETYHLRLTRNEASKYLAFQIGETSQILSGGALYATPHAVHGPSESEFNHIGRASFAVFMQPPHNHHMRAPSNVNISMVQFDRNLPPSVPTLRSRWNNDTGDTFGDFSQRTFETYY